MDISNNHISRNVIHDRPKYNTHEKGVIKEKKVTIKGSRQQSSVPPFRFEKPILSAPGPSSVSSESTEIQQLEKEADDDTGDDDEEKEEDGDDDEEKEKDGEDDDEEKEENKEDEEGDNDDDDDEDDEDDEDDDDDHDDDEDDEEDDDEQDTIDEYITEEEEIYFGVATTNPIITSYLEGYGLAAGHAEDEIQGLGLIGVFEPYKVSTASSSTPDHIYNLLISIVLCWLLFTR